MTFVISPKSNVEEVGCVCFGSGRFLRCVLVPVMEALHFPVIVAQTRGTDFVEMVGARGDGTYEVDTVEFDGSIAVSKCTIVGSCSLGQPSGKEWLMNLASNGSFPALSVVGVGVTEMGVNVSSQSMLDLTEFLHCYSRSAPGSECRLSIICTDNVPNSGNVIRSIVRDCAYTASLSNETKEMFLNWLSSHVSFHNTMVDRITAHRDGEPLVPRAEPLPRKALVIEDLDCRLPLGGAGGCDWSRAPGVVVRTRPCQIQTDIQLKLRIANGTHTSVVYAMALMGLRNTTSLATDVAGPRLLVEYLKRLYSRDISTLVYELGVDESECEAVFEDWMRRLCHPNFGMQSYFVCQNASVKLGIRVLPSAAAFLHPAVQTATQRQDPSWCMAFSIAVMMRFLTPRPSTCNAGGGTAAGAATAAAGSGGTSRDADDGGVKGVWVGVTEPGSVVEGEGVVHYTPSLYVDLSRGVYQFRDDHLSGIGPQCLASLSHGAPALQPQQQPQQLQQATTVVEAITDSTTVSMAAVASASVTAAGAGAGAGSVSSGGAGGTAGGTGDEDEAEVKFGSSIGRAVVAFLKGIPGFDFSEPMFQRLATRVAGLYARMLCGDSVHSVLQDVLSTDTSNERAVSTTATTPLVDDSNCPSSPPPPPPAVNDMVLDEWLDETAVVAVVTDEVRSVKAVDVHTHLFPPSAGSLCAWGIDALLTYHYLVAEYFTIAPMDVTPEQFYSWSQREQADVVWEALFMRRSPLSEAARGVITTLTKLGLKREVAARDLCAIRRWYANAATASGDEQGPIRLGERLVELAGLRYVVMTNVPFDAEEAALWLTADGPQRIRSPRFRSALRVDQLLTGDVEAVAAALRACSPPFPVTTEGAKAYLRSWAERMQPEYLMASAPHHFSYPYVAVGDAAGAATADTSGGGFELHPCGLPFDLLRAVLMPVAVELNLALALKLGAHRGVNPRLRSAGDGVVTVDLGHFRRLVTDYPNVKFLVTALARSNQHELCVLAARFRNVHIYGCWWFLNNPSLICELTRMRLELLGTGFTAQHSDARVLDQLVYKWAHNREVIGRVLAEQYVGLVRAGWRVSKREVARDVWRLFGGAYEEFLAK